MWHLTPSLQIDLRPIQLSDWDWMVEWFRDPWLNKELGPIDKEWLQYVLAQSDGVELVATIDQQPIGLVGVSWDSDTERAHVINSLAINPALRRMGFGRRVLKAALQWRGHPETSVWCAFTAKENHTPERLLLSMGWKRDGVQNDLHRFTFRC